MSNSFSNMTLWRLVLYCEVDSTGTILYRAQRVSSEKGCGVSEFSKGFRGFKPKERKIRTFKLGLQLEFYNCLIETSIGLTVTCGLVDTFVSSKTSLKSNNYFARDRDTLD